MKILPFLLLSVVWSAAWAQGPVEWTQRSPERLISQINIFYENGQWMVTALDIGVDRTSSDGVTWSRAINSLPDGTEHLAYGAGTWIATTRQMLWRSSNFEDWTPVLDANALEHSWFSGLHFANGQWVALATGASRFANGAVYTSKNGSKWTERYSRPALAPVHVIYGGGEWVAMHNGSSSRDTAWMLRSPDGTTWTETRFPERDVPGARQLIYGGDHWLLVDNSISDAVYTSTNLDEWTRVEGLKTRHVAYGDGLWVTLLSSNGLSQIATSTDGLTWTTQPENYPEELQGVRYGDGRWTIIGRRDMILTSTDGMNWTNVSETPGLSTNLSHVTQSQGRWIALGRQTAYSSTDLVHWTSEATFTSWVRTLVSYEGTHLALLENGRVALTTNSVDWDEHEINATIRDLAVDENGFIAMDLDTSGFVQSRDGIQWVSKERTGIDETNVPPLTLSYANGLWMAYGGNGDNIRRYLSNDGVNWATMKLPEGTHPEQRLSHGGGEWLISGGSGTETGIVLASSDGVTWESRSVSEFLHVGQLRYLDGAWIATGWAENFLPATPMFISENGRDWEQRSFVNDDDFDPEEDFISVSSIHYADDQWVAVGFGGLILVSNVDGPQPPADENGLDLRIQFSGPQQVTLQWQAPNPDSEFRIESSPGMEVWSPVTNPAIEINQGMATSTLPAFLSNLFYRVSER